VRAIVVGTDGSAGAERALRRAVDIAKSTGARLHLVTAYPDGSYREAISGTARTAPIDLREAAEGVLAREASHAQSEGVDVETQAREGDPAQVLIDVAEAVGAELIVVGARGLTGLQRWLLGSVSSKLSHHAHCDVMIVREDR
jgi:nucleotide-binding universal stress UspA family protein